MTNLTSLFYIVLEVLNQCNNEKKGNKRYTDKKGKSKKKISFLLITWFSMWKILKDLSKNRANKWCQQGHKIEVKFFILDTRMCPSTLKLKTQYHSQHSKMNCLTVNLTKLCKTCMLKNIQQWWNKLKILNKWKDIVFMDWKKQYSNDASFFLNQCTGLM